MLDSQIKYQQSSDNANLTLKRIKETEHSKEPLNVIYNTTIPLHYYVLQSNYEKIEYLLGQYNINIDAQDEDGNTALHYASLTCNGNLDVGSS